MNPLAEAKAIAADIEKWIQGFEERGPQPRIRHIAHMLAAEAERMMTVDAGTLDPGGIPKPSGETSPPSS